MAFNFILCLLVNSYLPLPSCFKWVLSLHWLIIFMFFLDCIAVYYEFWCEQSQVILMDSVASNFLNGMATLICFLAKSSLCNGLSAEISLNIVQDTVAKALATYNSDRRGIF